MSDLMTPGMSWLCAMRPRPIWPTRIRLFAPQARDEMNIGAATAVAVADLMSWRREIMTTISVGMEGKREYTHDIETDAPCGLLRHS
jgi:hypothetical protein